jgi:N-acetylmuramoyl-L-alanine amidase
MRQSRRMNTMSADRKILLLAGHAGTTFGHYWTPGKRSPQIPPGFYEGVMNREICSDVEWWLNLQAESVDESDKLAEFLNPGPYPLTLNQRVKFVNQITRQQKNKTILLDVHCNAAGDGKKWHKAKGFTVFIHPRASKDSETFAELLRYNMETETILKDRGIKRAQFKILTVNCPAVLIECGFMTNLRDAKYLENNRNCVVEAIEKSCFDFMKS